MMSTPPSGGGPVRVSEYRPFLDGLRAFAVLGVLVYHLDRDWLPGGYLGVDLFFVLSGSLITSLLRAEHARSVRIDLPAFWTRRVRRLLPALLVLLTVMAVVISLRGDVLAIGAARGDLLSTLFYVANWHFILSGQSYFSQYLAVSPDRHTWSLAIEEQFYLLWPIVVALILPRFRRTGLFLVGTTVALASALLMALLFDASDPSRAYYGTDTRIFEILLGALAAMLLAGPHGRRVGGWARRLAVPAAVVLLVAFVGLADNSPAYYHGAAFGLAFAAALLIVGLESGSSLRDLLSTPPLVAVGLASYGLYLWHFPVITFVNDVVGPTSSPGLALVAAGIAAAATVISYTVIEIPIRRRGMLLGLRLTPRRLMALVPAASGLVAATIVFTTASGVSAPIWNAESASAAGTSGGPAGSLVGTGGAPGGGLVVGVVGDSVMVSALPGLRAEASARTWALVAAAASGCPVGLAPLYDDQGRPSTFNVGCARVRSLHEQLVAAHPDIVVWEDLQSVLSRRARDGTFLPAGSAPWTADLIASWTTELDRFLGAGAQVVLVMPPLRSQQAPGCSGVPMQARCDDLQRQDALIRAATGAFWRSVAGRTGVHTLTVDQLLCPSGVPCPTTIDGIAVRISGWDQTHFTPEGARWYAPRLFDLVRSACASRGGQPP
jgi:peptidoglycan/LPS O-acetylase OafA/YrhL